LKSYLAHPSHAALGNHFTASASRSLAYDYGLAGVEDAGRLLE
jgi:hypothetical protein